MARKKRKGSSDGKGCLFLIFGTLCVIVAMFIYISSVTSITSAVIGSRYDGQPVYAIMKLQLPCIIAAFILFDGVLILQYLPNEEDYDKKQMSSPVGRKPTTLGKKRTTNLISVGLLLLVVLCGVISVNCYTLVGEEGISEYFFAETSTHKWSDVTSSRIDCDQDKGLSVTYTMKDGKKYEVMQGTISDSQSFADTYGTKEHFARVIAEVLDRAGIPRNVSHMERTVKFYRYNYPDQWMDVRVLIRYEELNPDKNELAPTEAPTEPATEPAAP